MKKKTKILVVLILVVIGILVFFWERQMSRPEFGVELSKQTYDKGEEVRITVQNNSTKQVCFSSCYPYYLQAEKGAWQSYNYPDCPEEDLNVSCITSGGTKEFEFTLEGNIETELHRVAIPVNEEGKAKEAFEEDKKVYSEPFDVK